MDLLKGSFMTFPHGKFIMTQGIFLGIFLYFEPLKQIQLIVQSPSCLQTMFFSTFEINIIVWNTVARAVFVGK